MILPVSMLNQEWVTQCTHHRIFCIQSVLYKTWTKWQQSTYWPEVWFTFESIYMRHSVSTYFICNYLMFLGYWWTMHKPYVAVVVKIYLYKIKLCSKSYICFCSCTHCTTNMMMHFFKKKRIESQIISQCNKNEKKIVWSIMWVWGVVRSNWWWFHF